MPVARNLHKVIYQEADIDRIIVVGLTLAILFGVTALPSANGQVLASLTPTAAPASPTVVPTSIPAGPVLLQRMRKAMVAERTVRIEETSVSAWKGHAVLRWTWEDLDLQGNSMRELDTILRTHPKDPTIGVTVERRELVVSRGMAANRKRKGAWSCEPLRGVRLRDSLVPFQIRSTNIRNLGPATTGGLPVWHLEADNAQVAAWSANEATVGLYISRSNNTLVRLSLNAVTRLSGAKTHENVTETYRRYGKPIVVTVPQQCS